MLTAMFKVQSSLTSTLALDNTGTYARICKALCVCGEVDFGLYTAIASLMTFIVQSSWQVVKVESLLTSTSLLTANLQGAVLVDQNVCGLEVAVNAVGTVHVLEAHQHLVQEGLDVRVAQVLRRQYELVEVRVHVLEDEVEVRECGEVARRDDVQ